MPSSHPRHERRASEQRGSTIGSISRTVTNYRQAEAKLVEFFGSRKLAAVTPLDADKFRSWLKGDKATNCGMGLAENSARSIVKNAKLIFGAAVKGKLLVENPFVGHSTAIIARPDRLQFVDLETIDRVLKSCPNSEWRAIVSLCRFGGLRCPSEVFALRWSDVDFERGRMRVRSPKLEGQQGEFREVPLFPEVRTVLEEHFMEPDGAEYVIRRKPNGTDTNLWTTFEKIVRRAGVEPWKKLFQNLRSSRETELAEQYPVHVVTKWLGNSPKVAMAHYLQVRDTDFAGCHWRGASLASALRRHWRPQAAASGTRREDLVAVPVVLLAERCGDLVVRVNHLSAVEVIEPVARRKHDQMPGVGQRVALVRRDAAPQRDARVHFGLGQFEVERQAEVTVVLLGQQIRADFHLVGVLPDDDSVLDRPELLIAHPTLEVFPVEDLNHLPLPLARRHDGSFLLLLRPTRANG